MRHSSSRHDGVRRERDPEGLLCLEKASWGGKGRAGLGGAGGVAAGKPGCMEELVREKDKGAFGQRDISFWQLVVLGGRLAQGVDIFVPN